MAFLLKIILTNLELIVSRFTQKSLTKGACYKMTTHKVGDIPVDIQYNQQAKHEIIQRYVADSIQKGKDEHFFICDIGEIIKKYQQWVRLLPRVRLFYAVKCNPDKTLLRILADLGASFDCASKNEIERVLELGVSPNRAIYTHTQKPVSSLIYSERNDVTLMTFDSESELRKMKTFHPTARLILRLQLQKKFSAIETFKTKFGCPNFGIRDLLKLAKELGLVVVGVSFHVGSGVTDPEAYTAALQESKDVFEIGQDIGFNIKIIDIGGGFPGEQDTDDLFREITEVINVALSKHFPSDAGFDIIAEPGRYIAASAYTDVVNIVGKRWLQMQSVGEENDYRLEDDHKEDDGNTLMYYVNDSAFGSFLFGRAFHPDCMTFSPRTVKNACGVSHKSIIWGFTCSESDCINPTTDLPELDVGDWLYFEDMGAYTICMSSNFNGLETPDIKYFCLADVWFQVYPQEIKEIEK